MQNSLLLLIPAACALIFSACSTGGYSGGSFGPPNMGGPTTIEERQAQIASEPTGSFYYGRRYFVEKTRFWGYLRKPGQSASSAKLVVFNESRKRNPDRLSEAGPVGQRYGFDQNYQYKIYGHYSGQTVYEVNSNQFLPEFILTSYQLVDKHPGWFFSPKDHYNPQSITLIKR